MSRPERQPGIGWPGLCQPPGWVPPAPLPLPLPLPLPGLPGHPGHPGQPGWTGQPGPWSPGLGEVLGVALGVGTPFVPPEPLGRGVAEALDDGCPPGWLPDGVGHGPCEPLALGPG